MNIKTRLFHILAFIVGVAALAATILSKLPKYAAVGAGLALFVADAEKISPALVAAVKKMFPVLAVLALLTLATVSGCTLLRNIEQDCKPTKSDETSVVMLLGSVDFFDLLKNYAGTHKYCIVDAVVSTYVSNHTVDAGAAPVFASLFAAPAPEPVEVQHGRSWLAARSDAGAP